MTDFSPNGQNRMHRTASTQIAAKAPVPTRTIFVDRAVRWGFDGGATEDSGMGL